MPKINSFTLQFLEMEKLTAIIPTGNEEHNIKDVLETVGFADQIMVVDSFSTDKTVEIARQYTDCIIQREYINSASQKNWAIPQADHDWILLVDADERVTPELRDEIQKILSSPEKDIVGYWIYRKNFFMGKHLKHSGLRNDKVVRLFRKDACRYEEKHVHAEIVTKGKLGFLKNRFVHNTYINVNSHINKLNRYAEWQAKDYDGKTGKITIFHFFIKPLWGFFKHFIIQGGFRDGVRGYYFSCFRMYAIFMRYQKLWLMRRNMK